MPSPTGDPPFNSRSYKSPHPVGAPRPNGQPLPESVQALRRAGQLQREIEEALRPWGMTWALYDTLLAIHRAEHSGQPVSATGREELGSGGTRRIEKLIRLGYVRKQAGEGRRKNVVLTDEGQAALSQATLQVEEIAVTPEPTEEVSA